MDIIKKLTFKYYKSRTTWMMPTSLQANFIFLEKSLLEVLVNEKAVNWKSGKRMEAMYLINTAQHIIFHSKFIPIPSNINNKNPKQVFDFIWEILEGKYQAF